MEIVIAECHAVTRCNFQVKWPGLPVLFATVPVFKSSGLGSQSCLPLCQSQWVATWWHFYEEADTCPPTVKGADTGAEYLYTNAYIRLCLSLYTVNGGGI